MGLDDFDKELSRLLAEKAEELVPFFDTVIVFATKHEKDGTLRVHHEIGNMFANYGIVKLWLDKQQLGEDEI